MTWECRWKQCGKMFEYFIDMCEHALKDHKDFPKETPFHCKEHADPQTKLFEVIQQ